MSKKTIIMCVLAVLTAAYICFALPLTHGMAGEAHMKKKIDICLSDPTSQFVGPHDIIVELGLDPDTLDRFLRRTFPLNDVEKRLRASDKLQTANVCMLSDGTLRVEASPMVPVARVFEPGKPSYYINADGKKISAELRYHIDVPVLVGTFDSIHPAENLLPLLDYISNNDEANSMVATVTQEADGNIILVPTIVGHVVNFGDTTMIADKFFRLRTFYRHVAPTKGWETYDTIAVKWCDRVVASRRNKEMAPVPIPTEEEMAGTLDIDDNEPQPEDIHPEIIEEQRHTLP